MATKIKNNVDVQPIDFRYDEGFRGRVDTNCSQTITTKTSGFSGVGMVQTRERERVWQLIYE